MSCDFGVLSLESRLTDKEAAAVYMALCDGDTSGVAPNRAVDDFYAELTAKHPEIDDVPDEEVDNVDLCPWSIAFDKSHGHLIICCVWSKADYVQELLTELSRKHGLALFNPQEETILYSDGHANQAQRPWWKLW